jgi:hypothetical protein
LVTAFLSSSPDSDFSHNAKRDLSRSRCDAPDLRQGRSTMGRECKPQATMHTVYFSFPRREGCPNAAQG